MYFRGLPNDLLWVVEYLNIVALSALCSCSVETAKGTFFLSESAVELGVS